MDSVTDTSWFERMRRFFDSRKNALSGILDAVGCREGWLQGEMFLAFSSVQGFSMNAFPLGSGKADISCAQTMVGEVKIIGAHHGQKCITGGSIRPFLRRTERTLGARDRELLLGKWGLIPDYFRLLDADVPKSAERLLVLIADVHPEDTTSLANALRTVDFDARRARIDLSRGFVRLWDVARSTPADAEATSISSSLFG